MPSTQRRSLLGRVTESRNGLGLLFMLPAAAFLLCFLTYPLGLGVWLGFTDTRIGREGIFIGLENYRWLADDSVFWLSVFNTLFYTTVASVLKFGLGLWLALILNEKLPWKSLWTVTTAVVGRPVSSVSPKAISKRRSTSRICRQKASGWMAVWTPSGLTSPEALAVPSEVWSGDSESSSST